MKTNEPGQNSDAHADVANGVTNGSQSQIHFSHVVLCVPRPMPWRKLDARDPYSLSEFNVEKIPSDIYHYLLSVCQNHFLHSPHHGQPSRCCHLSGCHSQCACAEQEKDVGGEEVIWALGCELHGSGSSRFDPVRRLWHPWFVHGRRGTSVETQQSTGRPPDCCGSTQLLAQKGKTLDGLANILSFPPESFDRFY